MRLIMSERICIEGNAKEIVEFLAACGAPLPPSEKQQERDDTGSTAAIATLTSLGYTYHGGQMWKPPLGQPPEFVKEETENGNPYINFKFEDVEVGDKLVFIDDREVYVVDTVDCNDRSYCGHDGYWKWYDDLYCGEYGKVTLEKKKK